MAKIALCIITSRPRQDGTFAIRFKITNGTSATYIATQYSVEKKQWNGGQVVRHPHAAMINAKLSQMLCAYQTKLDELNPPKEVPASKIREWLEDGNREDGDSVKVFGEKYIRNLTENGQASYALNMAYTLKYLLECFGESFQLRQISSITLQGFEKYLRKVGSRQTQKKTAKNGEMLTNPKPISDTSINIRMTHVKALLNAAVTEGIVEYKVFPFRGYKMPTKNVREIWISKDELKKLRETEFAGVSARRHTVARDLFMLSFYFAGINLTDLMDARLDSGTINFVRKKTATKKTGEKGISLTIQPEARAIIDKYIAKDGTLDFGYHYRDYEQFRSFVTKGLNKIGEDLRFGKKLMFYSARKTFVQFGQQLGIPLYVLEYAIGQSIKDANNRPIFDYMKVMRFQADLAIRKIIDFAFDDTPEADMPIPEWAK